MNNWWTRILFSTVVLLSCTFALSCSNTGPTGVPDQQPGTPASAGFGSATLRDVSGSPSGIRISWKSIDDAGINGYHIYKSASPITDDQRGDPILWLDVNDNPIIPPPPTLGEVIIIDDIFPVAIGEVYYYRISSLFPDGSESALSQEIAVTISDFSISGLDNVSVAVGDEFSILGENFGLYNPDTDSVTVDGMLWQDGSGFTHSQLICPVVNWDLSEIRVTLPSGTISSRVSVTIDGVTQQSLQNVINTNPFITYCSHLTCNPGDMITLSGQNFGQPSGPDYHVVFGPLTMTNSADYMFYSGDLITFKAPSLPGGTYNVMVEADGVLSNVARISINVAVGPSWEHTWGRSQLDTATGMVTDDATGVYLCGFTSSFTSEPLDTLIVKYDAGIFKWAQTWNNTDNDELFREESLAGICLGPAGNVYATGTALTTLGHPCVLLMSYDPDGNLRFARSWDTGTDALSYGNAIACNGTSIFIAGSITDQDSNLLLLEYDLDGNLLNSVDWQIDTNSEIPSDLLLDNNGDLLVIGTTTEALGASGSDCFILKAGTTLTRIWAQYWGTMSEDVCYTLAVTGADGILFGGASNHWTGADNEPLIVRMAADGSLVSEYRWTGISPATFVGLDIAGNGNLYAAASRRPGSVDAMFMILDPADYSLIDSRLYSGAAFKPTVHAGTIDVNDNILFCGGASSLGASWSDIFPTAAELTANTMTANAATELTAVTGVGYSLAGTNESVIATEDTGGGGNDLLVVTYNPE